MAKRAQKRKLADITLDEAVEVLKLGEGFYEGNNYQLRRRIHIQDNIPFAQLFHKHKLEEIIDVNFSDDKNAVNICRGNTYYRTVYRIIKYLEKRGFDLKSADKTY